jgi:hypothetical protein
LIRDIQNIDDDIIRKKRLIEQILYSDKDIVEILDNPSIDPECPEDLIYENIYPFIRVPGTQDVSKNFITFTVDDMEPSRFNTSMKTQIVQFVVFVHKNHMQTNYGMARHDLLGYLIKDIFHLSNVIGSQMELISNKEYVTDVDYATRTLRFELTVPNSIQPFKTNKYERDSIVNKKDRVVQRQEVGEV